MSWLCKLVHKGERCHTADENLGRIRTVLLGTYSVPLRRGAEQSASHPAWVARGCTQLGDLTVGKFRTAHYIRGRIPWGSLFGWLFLCLDLELGWEVCK